MGLLLLRVAPEREDDSGGDRDDDDDREEELSASHDASEPGLERLRCPDGALCSGSSRSRCCRPYSCPREIRVEEEEEVVVLVASRAAGRGARIVCAR